MDELPHAALTSANKVTMKPHLFMVFFFPPKQGRGPSAGISHDEDRHFNRHFR